MPDQNAKPADVLQVLQLVAEKVVEVEKRGSGGAKDVKTVAVCVSLLTEVVRGQEQRLREVEADKVALEARVRALESRR